MSLDGNPAPNHTPWVGVQWLITGKTQGGTHRHSDRTSFVA